VVWVDDFSQCGPGQGRLLQVNMAVDNPAMGHSNGGSVMKGALTTGVLRRRLCICVLCVFAMSGTRCYIGLKYA
jgi:hypothetical protein